MSKLPPKLVTPEQESTRAYYARRLREVASIGANAGGLSLGHWLKSCFKTEEPCTELALIQAPTESSLVKPEAMLPLFAGFKQSYALEIHRDSAGQIQFQVAYHADDNGVLANLRAAFGSNLTVQAQSVDTWNAASGLGVDSALAYLLPESSLYPLSFALAWQEADVVALVLESLKSARNGAVLVQLLVLQEPDSGRGFATDTLAAASHLGPKVEAFRLGLIRERFNCPLSRFALRLLGESDATLQELARSLCVLDAPFNRFREVKLGKKQASEVAEAVLERRVGLSDGVSLISLPELAGLWHLPLQPDYFIERALVREVATARLSRVNEPGRILGFHTLRGETQPVVLPYSARNNHFCCFGRSQSGKSTALARIAASDIESGLGIAIIDQHDLPSRVLPHIPPERRGDVILISPRLMASGRVFPLNLFDLGRKDAFAVEFVCETLKEILGRAFSAESIGPRTSYIFDVAVTALLGDPAPRAPYTVLDLSRVLLDKRFRAELAERQDDADTRDKLLGFDALPKDSFAAPLNKLQLFSRHSIRPMIAARENGFNTVRACHSSLLDAKPIIICDLADIPHASAVVIGSIVLSLVQLEAFKRDPQGSHDIFHCYIDEAGAFLNLENADLITRTLQETAKFRMSLGLINQSYETIPPVVRKTLSTNVGALMYFAMGIGSGDAKIAAAELHGEFTEDELNRLPVGRAALRLGGEVFSVASPDFKNPSVDQSAELIAHSLESKGVEVQKNGESQTSHVPVIAQSQSVIQQKEAAHTAESGGARVSAAAVSTDAKAIVSLASARGRVKLADLQGQAKQMAVLRLLAVAGLVPLADLSELFFPGSPEYGRQFLKTMAGDGLLAFVKLGKRLAYHLSPQGFAAACKSGKKVQAFALPEERLWEHAALVGAVATRFCAQAARAGFVLDAEREVPWQGVRPDLRASWRDEAGSQIVLVECDRATESKATFVRDKLVPYERALTAWRTATGTTLRLLVVVTEAERATELRAAARDFPKVNAVLHVVLLDNWSVNTDLEAIPHTEEKWRKW